MTSHSTAPDIPHQIAPRCDFPEPAGPASTTTGAGQSGHRSINATALELAFETTKSSREKPGACRRSSGNWRGFSISGIRIGRPQRGPSGLGIGLRRMPYIERRFQIARNREANENPNGRRRRDRDEKAHESNERPEREQSEHQPYRMQADAFPNEPGLQDIAFNELPREEDPGHDSDPGPIRPELNERDSDGKDQSNHGA